MDKIRDPATSEANDLPAETCHGTLAAEKKIPDDQAPDDIQVRLQDLRDDPLYDRETPLQITPGCLDHDRRSNIRLTPGEVEVIHDARGQEHQFSLDKHAFQYVHAPTSFEHWSSQPDIAREYLPELERLLHREIDGCDEIIFYDARLRAGDQLVRKGGLSYNPFARQVHTDNTEKSVIAKIRDLTEIKADYLLGGRCRIINIWRPIRHAVYDCGLAVAEGDGLRDDDVIECNRHRSDTGRYWDTMGVVKYRPGFNWWYMSRQTPDEVLLFKNYDSATDVTARYCLHTAFDLPPDRIPAGAPTRESIEVRALVFTYPTEVPRDARPARKKHPLAVDLERGQLDAVGAGGVCCGPADRDDEYRDLRREVVAARKKLAAIAAHVTGLEDKIARVNNDSGALNPALIRCFMGIVEELVDSHDTASSMTHPGAVSNDLYS